MTQAASLPSGEPVPALGQGTWRMGEQASIRAQEMTTIREGVALGMTLIDTAEMYGEGGSEEMLGGALAGLREEVFLVSKAYPQNGTRERLAKSCEASLRRLRTDRLDLYLLHWRGGVPLEETVRGMLDLKAAGKIRHWGVSNFDVDDLEELAEAGGEDCAANQVLYNLARRGPEFDLMPWMASRRMPLMAYTPLEPHRLLRSRELAAIALEQRCEPLQVALAWVLRRPDVIAIPKATSLEHVRLNREALDIVLTPEELVRLDQAFPPPRRKTALEMI
jgi:diketogulonate reductase-like aldo/keto reductase